MEYILEDSSGNIVETFTKQQEQLVQHLAYLSQIGKAYWFRRQVDSTCIYCALNDEMFMFELTYVNESQDTVDISRREPDGILGEIRNIKLLWLPGIAGWDNLISLLKSAEPNDQLFAQFSKRCEGAIYAYIENEVNSCS